MNSDSQERKRRRCRGWMIPFFIAFVIAVKSAIVFFLWNMLVPEAFHGPTLTYWQAVQLTILVKVLTMGRLHHGHHHHKRHRWMAMSPEDREKLREKLHGRCHE